MCYTLFSMPLRKNSNKAAAITAAAGTSKISSFFSTTSDTAKRPIKRPRQDSECEETPSDDMTTSKQPRSHGTGSPSHLQKAVENKARAEAKLWAKKIGAEELGATWMKLLVPEFKKDYFTKLMQMVDAERKKYTIYPHAKDVFSWTTACPLEEVKVVILGQDPYYGPGQAHGLCFSVRVGVPPPPSLQNMYKELLNSVPGFTIPGHGYLMGWAKQGVLLLNACLTVRHKEPNSHAGKGWEMLTDAVIHWINNNLRGVVFLLWGSYAQKKGSFIDKRRHHVLKTAHPSPLSANRGFFGCKHFSEANQLLVAQGDQPINWTRLPKTFDS